MKKSWFLVCLFFSWGLWAQVPASYNDFQVVTSVSQLTRILENTPSATPIYIVLAPGYYRLNAPIVIDRSGPVYIHGLSINGTHITDSTNYPLEDYFIVKRTQKFSLATLSLSVSKPDSLFRRGGIRFEKNIQNQAHDFEIQDARQNVTCRINAPGKYHAQSVRMGAWSYIINDPNADVLLTQPSTWGRNIDPYSPKTNPAQLKFIQEQSCLVWQKQGRLRVYCPQNVPYSTAYEYRLDSKSNLGPHVIAGMRSETDAYIPKEEDCAKGKRIYKAVVKVSGEGNELIFKANSPVTNNRFFQGECASHVAFVDFQAKNGRLFILGNTLMEGFNKMVMNTSKSDLGNVKIVLLGNKIASLPLIPNNTLPVPLADYADVKLGKGGKIYNMGNMTRLQTGGDGKNDTDFCDLFLTDTDSIANAPIIPTDVVPNALVLPNFDLRYNPKKPSDPNTNHELLWRNILINVQNYGAIPNDNKDDFAAIQRAADSALMANELLYFPRGQFDISQTIELNRIYKNPPNTITKNSFGNRNIQYGLIPDNTQFASILLVGAGSSLTTLNGLGKVLSIFSITNQKFSKIQGLKLRVNNGVIKGIAGIVSDMNPAQAIIAIDNFDTADEDARKKGLKYNSVMNWSIRDCYFQGGQFGLATQFRKSISGEVHSPWGTSVKGVFSGRYTEAKPPYKTLAWGGLGEMFAITNCKFENNAVGFSSGHHQAFNHFVSNSFFLQDSIAITQIPARGKDLYRPGGLVNDNTGGNFTVVNTTLSSTLKDFHSMFNTQTLPDYFNNCTFAAPTALYYSGSNGQGNGDWYTNNANNKNHIGFVENCTFTYDHSQDAAIKVNTPPIKNTIPDFYNYRQYTFVANTRSSIFCLNSDISKTTFIKTGNAPTPTSYNTASLQGMGYGMIAQCTLPGGNQASFSPYGTKTYKGLNLFNFDPNKVTGTFPQGYSLNPPKNMSFYRPKEIVKLDMQNPLPDNDKYFWRVSVLFPGGLAQRQKDWALHTQRILLYNAK